MRSPISDMRLPGRVSPQRLNPTGYNHPAQSIQSRAQRGGGHRRRGQDGLVVAHRPVGHTASPGQKCGGYAPTVAGCRHQNPDLTNAGQASIREIDAGEDANNALGTAIVVDGTPISNDANMQVFSTARSGSSSSVQQVSMNDQTTSGRGVDLRQISPDNIESIEVIRGIPSVEYGNLTSGAVIINTKAGVTP